VRGARPEAALEQVAARSGALRRGERVLIACSGGPDSVALAAVLHALAVPMKLSLVLAHVNHGLRRSAWQDECVALRVAAALELPIDTIEIAPQGGSERSLREARYEALEVSARRWGATAVATAHHAGDQTETVVLALFRGTGPDGLQGIPRRRALAGGIDVVRPLLRAEPELLRAYCAARALPYAVDPSNAHEGLRRNAVRGALDALRPLFPGLDQAVARAAEVVADDRSGSDRSQLRRRVRETLAGESALRDVDFAHVEAAVRAMERGTSGTFYMKAGVRLEIASGAIKGITRQ
jgi:tRNA(Ile)-lysidine synthase